VKSSYDLAQKIARQWAREGRYLETLSGNKLLPRSVEQQRSSVGEGERMLHKFLLIGASALALASSALAALPAVADDNDDFVLTQPNGKKIILSPISIIAIALPSEGLCTGETLIVTGPAKFCVNEQPEDVIKKLRDFPCVENPRTSAQTLRRCK
jgi:hypothetical protein